MMPSATYENFRAALYIRALDIAPLKDDISPLQSQFKNMSDFVRFEKVYLETHRDLIVPEKSTLLALRDWFLNQGMQVSAGITVTIDESASFKTFCYSDPYYRNKLKELVQFSASLFDEILFDDFFFNNCKCPRCIEAKGSRSWTDFRLVLMTQASKELVLSPARAINPDIQVVIKYPNWYEHFQGLGFNLKDQPPIYDGIYSGNETRNGLYDAQHLQPYESYLISRYYENIKPGGNKGGWVDPFGAVTLDRYAEQIWLTLLAKVPEIMLFDYYSLHKPVLATQRGSWQGSGTTFPFDDVFDLADKTNESTGQRPGHFVAAGAALELIDPVLKHLGQPVGISMYKPYHSHGDDFLVNYLGMIGLPMNLVPEFSEDADMVILSRSASFDPQIVDKIKQRLLRGKPVVITSGLLEALQDKGLQDIVEMRYTNKKISAKSFQMGWDPKNWYLNESIVMPVIEYFTNDSWELISCNSGYAGTPLLHSAAFGLSHLYILNIPDNPSDLYTLPPAILERVARTITVNMPLHLEAPGMISLFLYDNDTFLIHSFRDEPADIRIHINTSVKQLVEIHTVDKVLTWPIPEKDEESNLNQSGKMIDVAETASESIIEINNELLESGKSDYRQADLTILPHSFRLFRFLQ